MPESETPSTYSVVVRLRRTVTESVHMSVLVTNDLIKPEPEPDGTFRLDVQKLFAAAIEKGKQQGVSWVSEGEPAVVVHPLQTPP